MIDIRPGIEPRRRRTLTTLEDLVGMPVDEVQAEVDRLAIGLHRSVVITDPAVRLLYMSRHFGDEDSVRVQTILNRETDVHAVAHVLAQGVAGWTKAGVIPANEGLGLRPRYCVPLRWRGRLLGFLMITIDDEATTPPGIGSVEAAAKTITARLAVQAQGDDADQVEDALVHALVSPEPVTRRRALAELDDKGRHAEIASATAVVIRCSQLEDDGDGHYFEAVCRTAFARLHTEVGHGDHGDHGDHLYAITQSTVLVVVLVRKDHNDQPAVQFTHQFIRTVSDLSDGRLICTAGVGQPFPNLEDAYLSAEQARIALRAAGATSDASVIHWTHLGPMATLLQIPTHLLNRALLPSEVQRLLAAENGAEFAQTLRQYFDSGGSGPAAAGALHIHRTSLYYRLSRITELTGLDLTDGRTRLALHVGLVMLDLIERHESGSLH